MAAGEAAVEPTALGRHTTAYCDSSGLIGCESVWGCPASPQSFGAFLFFEVKFHCRQRFLQAGNPASL